MLPDMQARVPFKARVPFSPEERARVVEARQSGMSVKEIADELKRDVSSIGGILRREGFSFRPRPPRQSRDITVRLGEAVHGLLSAAAQRRKKSVEALAGEILVGVLCRGSIYSPPDVGRALAMADDYERAH